MSYPVIKKIMSEDQRQAVMAAARDDGDMMQLPSHVIEKDGQIAGAYNLANIPFVAGWHSQKIMKARDTIVSLNAMSSIMNDRFQAGYFVTCSDRSPLFGYMEKLGYIPVWDTRLFYRKL